MLNLYHAGMVSFRCVRVKAARQYSADGERHSFARLHPNTDTSPPDRIRDLVLQAFAACDDRLTQASSPTGPVASAPAVCPAGLRTTR